MEHTAKEQSAEESEEREAPNDWFLLLTFSFFALVTQIGYVHLPSIVNSAARYYKCSPESIMTFSNVFPLFSCIFGWVPLLTLRYRFDLTVIFSSLVCSTGFWVVLYALDSYQITLLGHLFLSVSNVFNLSPAIYLAYHYFSYEKRALAISIPYYFCLFGTNFGYLVSTNMVNKYTIQEINFFYALIGSLQLILCLLAYKRYPKKQTKKSTLTIDILKVKQKPRAILSLIVLSVYNGVGSAIISLIAFMFTTSATSETLSDIYVGISALVYNTAGAVFGISLSKILYSKKSELARAQTNARFIRMLYVFSSISMVLFAIFCNHIQIRIVMLCLTLFAVGGSLNGSYSLIIEFIAHKYSLSQLLVSNIFNISSNCIAYTVIIFMSSRERASLGTYVLALMILLASCYLKLVYFNDQSSLNGQEIRETQGDVMFSEEAGKGTESTIPDLDG